MKKIIFNVLLFILLTLAFSAKSQIIDTALTHKVWCFYSFIEDIAMHKVGAEVDSRDWEEFTAIKTKKLSFITDSGNKITLMLDPTKTTVFAIVIDIDRDSLGEMNEILSKEVERTGYALNNRIIEYSYVNAREIACKMQFNYATKRLTLYVSNIL